MKKQNIKKATIILLIIMTIVIVALSIYAIIDIKKKLAGTWDTIKSGEKMTYEEELIYCYIRKPQDGRPQTSGDYIAVLELTSNATEKDTIIIPNYIEGKPVVQLGMQGLGFLYKLNYNSKYTSIYLPKTLQVDISSSYQNPNCKYFFQDLDNIEYLKTTFNHFYVSQSLYDKICENYDVNEFKATLYVANVEFVSENETYFIADYEIGSKITYIPDEPMREGYIFDGWYKEPSCVTKWEFETDTFALSKNETILKLYAKWIKII